MRGPLHRARACVWRRTRYTPPLGRGFRCEIKSYCFRGGVRFASPCLPHLRCLFHRSQSETTLVCWPSAACRWLARPFPRRYAREMPPLHTVSHNSSVLSLAQVTQTRAGPRKTIDSSRIHPSAHGLFAAVAPKPIRSDEEPREALRIKQPPPGAYDENGAQKLPGSYERLHTGSTHRVSAWQGAGSCQIRPRPRVSYTPSGGSTCA